MVFLPIATACSSLLSMLFCGWAMKNNREYKGINFQLLGLMLSVSLASSFGMVAVLYPWLMAGEGLENNQALFEQNQELIHQQQELIESIEAMEQSNSPSPRIYKSIPEKQLPHLTLKDLSETRPASKSSDE